MSAALQVSKRHVVSLDRAALNAATTVLSDDGLDLVHDRVDHLRVVRTHDDRFDENIERVHQAPTVFIRQN